MNKKIQIAILIVFGVFLLGFFIKPKNDDAEVKSPSAVQSTTQPSQPLSSAEKIEVVHFHGTQQCVSCISVGKLALETIKTKFPAEYESRKIVFKDINGELNENQEIVQKYQARGSSLFVNAVRGGVEDIKEDTTVWRLVSDESKYVTYFEGKLKTLLGE